MRLNTTVALGFVVALAAAVPSAAGASAEAEPAVTISGGGWGHGMGMSQYGAYGRALNGDKAAHILHHYYTGVHIAREPMPSRVRVGLLEGRSSISIGSSASQSGGGHVVFRVRGERKRVALGGPGTSWRAEPTRSGGVALYKNGKQIKAYGSSSLGDPSHPLVLEHKTSGTVVEVKEKALGYAYGKMELASYPSNSCDGKSCLRLVLSLPVQKYLYGLGEMPSSWPLQALKAQAIAGRTYALHKIATSGQHRSPCDCAVYDSTYDQAYVGDAKRTGSGSYWGRWVKAVKRTKRKVVTYKGAPILALYSSSSGGHTENNENVWGGDPIPYLRGVRDAADAVAANPNHRWKVSMPWSSLSARLNTAYGTGTLRDIDIIEPLGVSGRVTVVKSNGTGGVRIVGSSKTARVSGTSLRSALGLRDTLFSISVKR